LISEEKIGDESRKSEDEVRTKLRQRRRWGTHVRRARKQKEEGDNGN